MENSELLEIGYSELCVKLFNNNTNFGLDDIELSFTAACQSPCGDLLILGIKVENDKIIDARFEYVGCIGLHISAAGLTQMLKDKNMNEIIKIGFHEIIDYLQQFPEYKYDCVLLTVATLEKLYNNWLNINREIDNSIN